MAPRLVFSALLSVLVLTPSHPRSTGAQIGPDALPIDRIVPLPGGARSLSRLSATTASRAISNPGAIYDTVWVGHGPQPGVPVWLGVRVGGVWDFDSDLGGTDSTQGWRRWTLPYRVGGRGFCCNSGDIFRSFDFGNAINEG